jgi:hypothetical protein
LTPNDGGGICMHIWLAKWYTTKLLHWSHSKWVCLKNLRRAIACELVCIFNLVQNPFLVDMFNFLKLSRFCYCIQA